MDKVLIDNRELEAADAARRQFLHETGRHMEGVVRSGSVEFHFNEHGFYTGIHKVLITGNQAKEA